MFNSALSTTPSDSTGLTALAVWILSCIVFVFIALLFYLVILINMKRTSMKISQKEEGLYEQSAVNPKKLLDLDPLFLVVHILAFAFFTAAYLFKFCT